MKTTSILSGKEKLFEPLKLGRITLSSNVVQGPLAGYSTAAMRQLPWRFGGVGFCTTEMLSVKTLLHYKGPQDRYLARSPAEKVTCYQIAGREPDELARSCERLQEIGADIIDLNCGCPVQKIRKKGIGSRLLMDPERLFDCVRSMRQASHCAISVKIRVAEPAVDHDMLAVLDAIQEGGADFMIVHGRHWTERYDVDNRLDAIKAVNDKATIPVFANGDVACLGTLTKIKTHTGCAGVMIARASVGQPWLFQKLSAESRGETFTVPTVTKIGQLFLEHLRDLAKTDGEYRTVLQARKLAKYYARTLERRADWLREAQMAENFKTLEALVVKYFK